MHRRIVVFGIIALSFAVGVALAADATLGTWKTNVAKSQYSPGPAPKSNTAKFEASGDNIKVTVDGSDGEGKPVHNEWVGKYDGKDYPVKGDPNTDTRSYKKIDDYTLEVVSKKAGKVTTTSKAVYSRDGKTRTLATTGSDVQGRKVNNTVLYEKQ
jgi:hypothetical protein